MNKRAIFFALAVFLQGLILFGVPAKKVYTRSTGRDVVLKVAPVDPYSVLSGYYVTLSYDITRPQAFQKSPNPTATGTIYAILEQQADGNWKPISLEESLPQALPSNRVALRGDWKNGWINYGIEEFYIPEGKRQQVADDLNKNRNEARVDVKVDSSGNAALIRLRIQDRIYE